MSVKIGLDAGHGLKTAGKQTPDGIKEWTLNDKVRDKVVSILADYDVEIIHTDNNEGNADESLSSRLARYKAAGVKVFVSIHHNANTGTWNNATGVETYTDKNYTPEDDRLARCIQTRLVKYTGLRDRGVKRANWAVINQNRIPAVLVEGGFMDGTNDYKYIISDTGQTAYAKAVAEGLIEFLGLKKKTVPVAEPSASTSTSTTSRFETGDAVKLSNTPIYSTASTKIKSSNKTGTYYIWSSQIINGRIKITNSRNKAGVSGQVTGFVNVSDISTTPAPSAAGSTATNTKEFRVKIKASSLNIRAGAGTSHKVVGKIRDKGVYTIVETSGSWGRLKSGKGWICISSAYAEKV